MALTPQKPSRKYNSTQAELYEVCKLGVKSFEENFAEFTNWKAFYTQQWANDFKQEIEDAENLPSFQARNKPSEILTTFNQGISTMPAVHHKNERPGAFTPSFVPCACSSNC